MRTTGRRTRLFTYLDGAGHSADEVGGKGAGLDRLIALSLPVPTAAALTTHAYRTAVDEKSLQLLLDDLRASPLPRADRIPAESAAIERTFLAAPLPNALSADIARIGREMLPRGPVAVRSSATAEDLSSASFAGQYLTITNVSGVGDLEVAVRRCWASLWMPAARAYRRKHQISEHHLAMAVVIQTMVDPQWSGVLFTTDHGGETHLIRVEAVAGLGDALVSGRVTPSDYRIRKDSLEIMADRDAAQLDFLEDLARLAIDLEQSEHCPQDIEWAYTADGLTILQARPITKASVPTMGTDYLDTPAGATATYTPHGVLEMLPGVVPPLLWTINAPMLENAFRTTLADLGGKTPDKSRRIVCRFRGRAALDLSALCDIASSLPGGSAAEVERQYLGYALSDDAPANGGGFHILPAFRARRVHNRIVDEVALISAAARAINEIQLDLRGLPARRLVAYRQRIRDLAWRGYAAEVGASSAASATYRALELLLTRWLSEDEAAEWAQRTTRGALSRSAVGAARTKALVEVVDTYATTEVKEIIASETIDQRNAIADLEPSGTRFLVALDRAVRAMGSKSIYGDRTWVEDQWWIWRQLQLLVSNEPRPQPDTRGTDAAFAELCSRLSSIKGWRRARILTGQVVDLRIRWLRRQVSETIRFLELRERAKNALLVLGGEERRIIVESARRLVESRLLPTPDLVQYLTDAELDGMLFGKRTLYLNDLLDRQYLAAAQASDEALPDWFTGRPDRAAPIGVDPGSQLEGWAAGPGIAAGTVRIISSLEDGTRLQRGDVLVAHATDPSWTPLFLTAGAVVLETGGPLAHAAIVAREFGLPAVLNIPSATRILEEGETVRVDGTLGIVERVVPGGIQ
jgi:phosphohistidine swiveling domain-containing protein